MVGAKDRDELEVSNEEVTEVPRECIAYVKYKDGHAVIATCRLEGNAPFGFDEMRKWIMEDDPEVVEATVSKVPDHLKGALRKFIKSKTKDPQEAS